LKLKAKFFLANYIGLLCSSHSNNSKSVEFRFKYTSLTGKNFTASCHANQTGIIHYNNSHWLIYRMKVAPYDCILAIQNSTYDYSGAYACVGHFFIDGKIEKVSSNHIELTEVENVSPIPPLKPSGEGGEIYLSIPIAIVLVLLLLVVIRILWKKWRAIQDRAMQGGAALLAQPDASAELVLPYGSTMIGVTALHASNPVGQGDASMYETISKSCLFMS